MNYELVRIIFKRYWFLSTYILNNRNKIEFLFLRILFSIMVEGMNFEVTPLFQSNSNNKLKCIC